jgi:hypothetical protein
MDMAAPLQTCHVPRQDIVSKTCSGLADAVGQDWEEGEDKTRKRQPESIFRQHTQPVADCSRGGLVMVEWSLILVWCRVPY